MELSVSWEITTVFLGIYSKNALLLLTDESENIVSKSDKGKVIIIQAILRTSDYDDQFAKTSVVVIAKKETDGKEK